MQLKCKHKISLLAFDLDGTLLNSAKGISSSTIDLLRALMEKGIKITTCSGRITYRQHSYVQQLGFKGPYVACNGSLVVNSANDEIIYSKPLAAEDLDKLITYSRYAGLHLALQTLEGVFFSPDNPIAIISRQSRQADNNDLPPVRFLPANYEYNHEHPVYKVSLYIPQGSNYTEAVQFLDSQPGLIYAFSDKNYLDVNPQGTSKGRGIERVADFYGIPLSEVCAFGDYDNDIPSFERAGISVAMGNASESLKARAMYITDTNDNDGIGKALTALAGCF